MPTTITNTASATYGYGRTGTGSATSNQTTATLLDEFAISATKRSQNEDFRPGENISYYIQITNTGTSPLYNITVADDNGGSGTPLTYLSGSAYQNYNGTITAVNPTTTSPLTFVFSGPLAAGESVVFDYVSTVGAVTSSVSEITNTATVTANSGSASGTQITASPSPTVTLPLAEYASVLMTKTTSADQITEGVPFSYTLTLENSGNQEATGVVITDVLPENFVISSITVTTGGVTQTVDSGSYTYTSSTRTLTLPTGSTLELTVPASTSAGTGKTIVVITGQINS